MCHAPKLLVISLNILNDATSSVNPSTCQQQHLNWHQEGIDTSLISKYKQSKFMKHFGFVFLFVALVIVFPSRNKMNHGVGTLQ